jgi:putative oxidoreductase
MTLTDTSLSTALLLLRLVLGAVIFAHGSQKVLGWFGGYGLQGTKGYFANALGIPAPLFYLAAFTEFFGGIAIVLGLFTNIAALGVGVIMLVATFKAHWTNGFFMNWGNQANRGEGFEYSLTLAVLAAALVITGPGLFSVQALLIP